MPAGTGLTTSLTRKDLTMKKLNCFVLAVLAGIMISIGGIIYLSCENKVIGALLFSVGLFYVVSRRFNLYTGKIGYIVENGTAFALDLGIIWIGNFIGALLTGSLMRLTRQTALIEKAYGLCDVKINDTALSIFILAFFCGVLMYLAVDGYKTIPDSMGKNLAVLFSVTVFILCGFEHCVANMFYFSIASYWSGKVILYLIIMTLGNSAGAIAFSGLKKYIANHS